MNLFLKKIEPFKINFNFFFKWRNWLRISKLFKNKDRWTKAELEDALDYINRERKKVDLPLLNLEL